MATSGKNSLTLNIMGNTFKDLLCRNYWVNWNQTWSQKALDGLLSTIASDRSGVFPIMFNVKLFFPLVAILDWEQNSILREQDNMLWE
jgi:hypothetical protein